MITIPVWLFATLCAAVAVLVVLFVRALLRADRRVDQILAEELAAPALPPVGSDIARDGAPRRVQTTVTERAPRRRLP